MGHGDGSMDTGAVDADRYERREKLGRKILTMEKSKSQAVKKKRGMRLVGQAQTGANGAGRNKGQYHHQRQLQKKLICSKQCASVDSMSFVTTKRIIWNNRERQKNMVHTVQSKMLLTKKRTRKKSAHGILLR